MSAGPSPLPRSLPQRQTWVYSHALPRGRSSRTGMAIGLSDAEEPLSA